MAPFKYDAPSSPFGATIAELLSHQSDASIQAALQMAALRARAQEQTANINAQAGLEGARAWSGAIQTLGNLPLNVVKTMSDKRLDDAKIAGLNAETGIRQQALAQQQRADAGQQTLARAMQTSVDPSMQPQGPDLSQPNGVVPQTPNFLRPEGNGVSTWDVESLSKYMAGKGYGDLNQSFVKDVNGLNEVVRTEAAARQATIRHIADMAHRAGNDTIISKELVRTLRVNGFYPPETLDQIEATIGTPAFDKIVDGLRTPDKFENAAPGSMARNEGTGMLVPGSAVPEKPPALTPSELALRAAGGDAAKALELQQGPATTTAVETARHNKELERIAGMTAGRTEAAAAETARHNRAMEGAAATRAQTAADVASGKNQPIDVAPDVQTTISGKKYIDLSLYQGTERNKARAAATAEGAVPISKEQAAAIKEIDNARANQRDIKAQVEPLLPKSPVSRAAALVSVPLSKLLQTNDKIAAFKSWRSAAINTLRATAGSTGFRLNRDEILLAVENDIPQLTDTWGVAQQKLANVAKLLDNAESSILVRDRSTAEPTATPTTKSDPLGLFPPK